MIGTNIDIWCIVGNSMMGAMVIKGIKAQNPPHKTDTFTPI